MEGKVRSDSPVSRRIVLAFLDFLKSVEPAPGVDLEGLDVARECLEEVFKLNQSSIGDGPAPRMLIDLFASREAGEQHFKPVLAPATSTNPSGTTSTSQNINEGRVADAELTGGALKDELFGKFFAALEKTTFFSDTPDGPEDPVQVAKAYQIFTDAIIELENSQGQTVNFSNIAEKLKLKGNQFVQQKLYHNAVEFYTCAIALCEKNAVYYCNRAAAYTQLERYGEAIEDCLKSIEIDPRYCKAYNRLGMAYYSQGNYLEALNQGFEKALLLDSNNDSIKQSIRACHEKLVEQFGQEARQNGWSTYGPEFPGQATWSAEHGAPSTSIPIHASTSIPADFANMFRNMTSAAWGNQAHERTAGGNAAEGNGPGFTVEANVTLGVGEAPADLSEALRFVMNMVSPQQQAHGHTGDQSSSS